MEQHIRRRAEERVERRFTFFAHLVIYLVINIGAFFVWFFVTNKGKGFPWFLILAGGWGVGLLAHFLSVFVFGKLREKMIDKEAAKLRKGMHESKSRTEGRGS
ncbi:hypothetical protein GF359_06985 [candidate division WOR-3 bacterium]|uniref:2TM domain-containing protein n=1 Tax=candidate division WOR-3 bacterium TaxID=2052148 RepID=A0A9D5K9Q7_UNCW3|nr:hypothetical protein [candidate division WOR-3 bacterium]MBD3364943.1 hypothetical protein [candidate division WOR-3 bacterium]